MRLKTGIIACTLICLAGSARAQAALDSLVAVDRGLSDSGFAALVAHGANDLVLVYPGAPVVAGRANAERMLEAQAALRGVRVRWVPLHGEVSRDGGFGVTYGVTAITDSSGALRFGKYLSAWRRDGAGWKLVAHSQVGLLPSSAFTAPAGFQAGSPSIPSSFRPFAIADSSFAAQAGRSGAADAFAAWIAPDGAMFSGSGEIVRGPEGAHRLLDGGQASWWWQPVAAFGSSGGDLGATVGEAIITPPGGGAPNYSKYLTLWRRLPDGSIRFLADGGNGRPARPR